MARGITGISFGAEDLETGQIKEYPALKNCKVYGVMANSLTAYISADILEKSRQNSEKLEKDGYKYSGIKWVYGKVNSLEKGGIQWLQWFYDANRNNKKDPGEENIQNKPLKKISGTDVYEVGGSYNLANPISLWFDKDEKFAPALYWVEPFLIHPELHFGREPKGLFIIPTQHPGPFEVVISCEKHIKREPLTQILASTVEQAKYTYLYYGENIEFYIETLQIPEGEKIEVRIEEESSNQTLYTVTATVKKNKPAQEGEESDELQDYLNQFKGFAEVTIPLDISKMPENQRKKEARVFKVQVTYFPSDYSLFNEMGSVVAASNLPSVIISSRARKEMANKPVVQSLTGYIQIMYEDTETYITTRNAPVNKMVEREAESLVAPGVEPCHYTEIKAQRYKDVKFSVKDGEEATIFDETKRVLPKSQPTIEVIAGDTKPAFLKLMANLHTNEACRPGTHTRGGKNVFYFHEEASAAQQNLTVVDIKEKEIDLSFSYIYIKDKKVAKLVSTFPFNYFWLTEKDKQPYVVMIETCRYKNDVLINVYPDIKWTLLFKFNFKEDDFRNFTEKKSYELKAFYTETEIIDLNKGTYTKNKAAGIQITKTTKQVPKTEKGGFKKLIELVKRIEASLTAEYADKDGKVVEHDVIEERIKPYYEFIKKIVEIVKLVCEFCDGEANAEDKKNKSQLDKEIEKLLGGRSFDGAMEVLLKKQYETEILYPSIAASATWFYKKIEDNKQPATNGQMGLQTNFKLKAEPIVGVKFTWDILELLCRRHPIAYLIKKALDLKLYLMNPKNKVNVTFSVAGQLELNANFNHNLKAGNAYTRGYSSQKEELASGGVSISANLKGEIEYRKDIYIIIAEAEAGLEAKIGVKAKIGNKSYLGADNDGLYLSRQTYCDGLTFYVEGKINSKLKIFGVTILDWSPEGKAEWTCGKFELDWVKFYFNNPQKPVQFFDTTSTE